MPSELTAANLQQRVCCYEPMVGEIDGQTDAHYADRANNDQRQAYRPRASSSTQLCPLKVSFSWAILGNHGPV